MNEALIEGYFKQGLDINDTKALLVLAEQAGLDKEQAKQALLLPYVAKSLQDKYKRVQSTGLTSIPAFILNDQTLVYGFQLSGIL